MSKNLNCVSCGKLMRNNNHHCSQLHINSKESYNDDNSNHFGSYTPSYSEKLAYGFSLINENNFYVNDKRDDL